MSLRSEVVRIFNELMGHGKKITELPVGSAPSGTELIEAVQGGQSVSLTVNQVSSGGVGVTSVVAGTNVTVDNTDPQNPIVSASGGGGATDWGDIGGSLTDQTDLIAELNLKEPLQRQYHRETTNYGLTLGDQEEGIEMNVAGANTVTVPLNATQAFPVGSLIPVVQYGAGLTSIVATGGVTINTSAGNLDSPGQYAPMFLRKIATNEWYLWNGTPGGGGSGQVNTVVGSTFIDVDATDPVNPVVSLDATGTPSATTFLRGDNTWATPAGSSGDVVGPGSATSGVPVLFNGTTGKLIMNSVPTGTGSIPVMSVSPALTGTPTAPTAAVATNTTQIATTAYVQANALVLKSSLIYPTFNAYAAAPISVTGNGQANLEFINLGNLIGNTEDRNLVPGGFYRAIGSILMSRNTVWSTANSRWEYSFSTADGYGAAWVEIGGEGVNFMAVPVGTHPYAMPTGGINYSVRGNGLRSTTSSMTYVNQTMAPMGGVYESVASGLPQWTDTGGTQPIIFALAEEAKGSGGALGNFYEAESHGSSYGGFRFLSSNGTKNTPTNSSSNKVVGSVYSTPYGGAYRRTAEMQFITRGTVNGSAVGQSILFRTSPDSDANIRDLVEMTYDGRMKMVNAPFEVTNTAVTTVPLYSSFAGFSPTNTSSSLGIFQHLSTSTGGTAIYGLSTTSTASTAIALGFIGVLGATSPTAPAVLISGRKNNGSNTPTDLASTETVLMIRNNATDLISVLGNGTFTIGSIAGSAFRANAAGTINLYNSGSAAVIGVGSSGNWTYTDKIWQTPEIRLTTSPASTASSAPIIDPSGNKVRFRVRPGSAGYMYEFALHTDVLDATTLAATTGGLLLSHTHSPASGSTDFSAFGGTPTLNQTGTFTGSYAFIRYTPTLTAVLGPHYGLIINALTRNGFGAGASPSAQLHLGAGTTAASTAPLKFTSGTHMTTAETGAMEYNGTNLFFTRTGTTREGVLTQSAVTTEVIVSDTSVTVNIGGVVYKLLARA